MKLVLSDDIVLPLEATTQSIVILAKKRAGKSYTMRRLTEQLLKASQQVVIVDPKGDQWGIRSSADGKKPGFPVVILGGEHGDAPLEPNSGEVVANLVVKEGVSVLLDLSAFRKHEIPTFMTGFLENLYRLKAQEIYRTAMMLVVDEADAIAPQKPQHGEERMLGAIDDIVRRGGQRGIGCTLVTQRSAVLNKNVLTQAQILVVLRTIAPQDLAAMNAWIEVHGEAEQRKVLMESLPSLPIGDAWFWSPGWPTEKGIFKRTHVLPIETFDSGATPKVGQKPVVPKNLADVDLEVLKKQMAETIETAKKDDPKTLRAEIARLTVELSKKEATPVAMGVSQWAEYGKKNGYWSFFEEKAVEPHLIAFRSVENGYKNLVEQWVNHTDAIRSVVNNATLELRDLDKQKPGTTPGVSYQPVKATPIGTVVRPIVPGTIAVPAKQLDAAREVFGYPSLKEGARKMLHMLVVRHPDRLTKKQLGTLVGFKPSGGTFGTYISNLRSAGLIDDSGGTFSVTPEGLQYPLGDVVPQTPKERQDMWRGRLKAKAREMFDEVLLCYPDSITKEQLGQAVGTVHTGGTFGTYLSHMKTAGLIEINDGIIRASDNLF